MVLGSVRAILQTAKLRLLRTLRLANVHEAPKLSKVVVFSGVDSRRADASAVAKRVEQDIKAITGAKPLASVAKATIAGFKLRKGQTVGYKATLRGRRMCAFLDKLLGVALPKTKEFKGLSLRAFDKGCNVTLGVNDYSAFSPSLAVGWAPSWTLGLNVTICVVARSLFHAIELLKLVGFQVKDDV
ncbi:putative 50S ribosomal subunit protein L5 [Candidatus Hodgkinia cicadicola Dsem]|nr:putative 50S ribosomal subunit protein L5 [Candidatus Hodgkinia cicadicola Dsem]